MPENELRVERSDNEVWGGCDCRELNPADIREVLRTTLVLPSHGAGEGLGVRAVGLGYSLALKVPG